MSFRTLLKRLQKKHYPTVRAMAQALGIDPSHLSRAMGPSGQPFDVLRCLRLAQITGEPPGAILRAAGKHDIAVLIEGLYGTPNRLLTPQQQQLLEALATIEDPVVRQSLLVLARRAAGLPNESSGSEGSTEGGGPVIPPAAGKPPGHVMGQYRAATRGR
jgi:hypothetical protein